MKHCMLMLLLTVCWNGCLSEIKAGFGLCCPSLSTELNVSVGNRRSLNTWRARQQEVLVYKPAVLQLRAGEIEARENTAPLAPPKELMQALQALQVSLLFMRWSVHRAH